MRVKCWFDFDDAEWETGTPGHTCMLPDGHEGPHEPTPDDQIIISFVGDKEDTKT
jgi:hypothetical protein